MESLTNYAVNTMCSGVFFFNKFAGLVSKVHKYFVYTQVFHIRISISFSKFVSKSRRLIWLLIFTLRLSQTKMKSKVKKAY